MSVEQKLRENLNAAAEALIVPGPQNAPAATSTRTGWWRSGPGIAIAGAAAALLLAAPALLLWSGRGEPITDTPEVTGSIGQGTVSPPTSAETTSTTAAPDPSPQTIAEVTVGDHVLALEANRVDEEDQPTATLIVQATPTDGTEPIDTAIVPSQVIFWHTVTAEEGVCEFSAEPTENGAEVTVQILLSPSIGCSDPYVFQFEEGILSPVPGTALDAATYFVVAWQTGDDEMMAGLSSTEVMDQAADVPVPADPVFDSCEGAAGSLYCTWEVAGGELVIRVANQAPFQVTEVTSFSD